MKKYMVYGILIGAVLGYSKAEIVLDDTLPVNTQICKAKEQLDFEKGNASVGVLEGQDPCVIPEEADSIKIFSLQKTTYCLPGEIITNGECTGKFGGGGGGGGQMPFGDEYKNGLSGRYGGRDSYSCVKPTNFFSSTPSSSIFSSLGACSPGGSSSGGNAQSPKPDPKANEKTMLLAKVNGFLAKNPPELPSDAKDLHFNYLFGNIFSGKMDFTGGEYYVQLYVYDWSILGSDMNNMTSIYISVYLPDVSKDVILIGNGIIDNSLDGKNSWKYAPGIKSGNLGPSIGPFINAVKRMLMGK